METLPLGTYFIIGQTEGFIRGYSTGWYKDYILYGDTYETNVTESYFHSAIKAGYVVIPQGRFELWESCECGAHKCGISHRDWCPAYREHFK